MQPSDDEAAVLDELRKIFPGPTPEERETILRRLLESYRTTKEGRNKILDTFARTIKRNPNFHIPKSCRPLLRDIFDECEKDGHDVQGLRFLFDEYCARCT